MSEAPFKLLVAIDFTEMTPAVVAATVAEAQRHPSAEIHGVCVVDRTHDSLGREVDHTEELTELERALSAHLAGQMSAHADAIRVHARAGRPAEEITAVATEIQADRIIVGRHSREGTRPDILGSVPMRILQLARCDVLVVQPNDYA